jgi:hypothetical protein
MFFKQQNETIQESKAYEKMGLVETNQNPSIFMPLVNGQCRLDEIPPGQWSMVNGQCLTLPF